jgi:membrane protein insertase Oxa1/YidC/SpoIIIJ
MCDWLFLVSSAFLFSFYSWFWWTKFKYYGLLKFFQVYFYLNITSLKIQTKGATRIILVVLVQIETFQQSDLIR